MQRTRVSQNHNNSNNSTSQPIPPSTPYPPNFLIKTTPHRSDNLRKHKRIFIALNIHWVVAEALMSRSNVVVATWHWTKECNHSDCAVIYTDMEMLLIYCFLSNCHTRQQTSNLDPVKCTVRHCLKKLFRSPGRKSKMNFSSMNLRVMFLLVWPCYLYIIVWIHTHMNYNSFVDN